MTEEEIKAEIERREKIGAKYGLNFKNRFTDKEMQLLTKLDLADMTRSDTVSIMGIYRAATLKCFIENRQGPEVESLRRVMIMFESDNPVPRSSQEFQDLIILE